MDELLNGLTRLKLRHTRESLDEYCRLAAARNLSNLDFLRMIIKEEVAARDETQYVKRFRAARFPSRKTFEEFDFSFQPSLPKRELLELQTLRFIDQHENVIFLGPPG